MVRSACSMLALCLRTGLSLLWFWPMHLLAGVLGLVALELMVARAKVMGKGHAGSLIQDVQGGDKLHSENPNVGYCKCASGGSFKAFSGSCERSLHCAETKCRIKSFLHNEPRDFMDLGGVQLVAGGFI